MTLFELYGHPSDEFIAGFIAAVEYYATIGRVQLKLYGRPITREVLELEKQGILAEFTQDESEIKL